MEWKGELKAMQNVGKGLNKVLNTVVKYILQDLPLLGEYGSEFSILFQNPETFLKLPNCQMK